MNDIEQTYTIQWVGPFHSLSERDDYFKKGKKGEMCDPSLFSFYYFRGNKKVKAIHPESCMITLGFTKVVT